MPHLTRRAATVVLGTVLAIGIPTGLVLATSPSARHGVEVSAVAKVHTLVGGPHNNHGGAVSVIAKTKSTTAVGAAATHPSNHGAVVSAIAKNHTLVGGPHNNHGGAVSAAAHGHAAPDAE